ncbi:hypothetical protein DXG01_004135 [Tephrocybe rancida]|nr:hypothetical protein DXG01_004135 [Tephrocybe rancida]
MPPQIPPGTVLEVEWLLNEQHEQQEHKCNKLRVQALLAQQINSPSNMVTEQDELETENGSGSGPSVGEGGQGAGSEGDVWEGILAIVPGSKPLAHPAHLDFVLDKLFVKVMRVLRLQDPTPEWCATARCSNCIEHGVNCVFIRPEKKHCQIPCVPCCNHQVKCPLRDIWLAELVEQTMGWPHLWCLEQLPNIGHLKAADPQVPIDNLFMVWQCSAAGVLPGGPHIPSSSSVSKRKCASLTASPPPSLLTEGNTSKGKQCQVISEDDADDGRVVGKMGTHHLRIYARRSSMESPSCSLVSPTGSCTRIYSGPPTNHPLINLDSDVEVSTFASPPHTFSILQPQRIHPQRPPYFVEPSEDGEVVNGLEEGISAMSPPEILGMIQQELNSLTLKQLHNLLLHVKGQHQTEFKHMGETAKGWRK